MNNYIKRLLATIMCLSITCSFFGDSSVIMSAGVTVFAFGKRYGNAGETVSIPITVKQNAGIAAYRFQVSYDTSILTFISAENGHNFSEGSLVSNYIQNEKVLLLNWYSIKNVNNDGTVVSLNFKIAENANGKYKLLLKCLPEDIVNESLEMVNFNIENGEISTVDYIRGDINRDGSVDIVDLILLKKYIAKGDTEEIINFADLDLDGLVSATDLVILKKLLIGIH